MWSLWPRLLALGMCLPQHKPQGATEEISDTLSPTREQMIPHTGAVSKKEVTLFHRCLYCLSPPSLARQNMTIQRAEYPRQHTAELPRQHIVTQIFQMTYCQAIDALSLRSWPTPIKPNNQASCGRPFYMRRNIHGGAYEDTSIKHLSSIQAQMQTV